MVRPLSISLGLALTALALAAPEPATVALDRAEEALASDEPERAVRLLEAVRPSLTDPRSRSEVACLLGHAHLAAGDPRRAEEVLSEVPAEASCGRRAAWQRATALQQLGRPEEAAVLAESLGELHVGPDRHSATAEAMAELADRLLADPERSPDQGRGVLEVALGLAISEERARGLARRWADLALASPAGPTRSERACGALLRGLRTREDSSDRARAAGVCDPLSAELVVAGVASEGERAALLATLREGDDPTVDALRRRAQALLPSVEASRAHALWLADLQSLDAVRLLRDAEAPSESARALELTFQAGRWSELVSGADRWLDRFPLAVGRASVEERRAAALLALLRLAAQEGSADQAMALADDLAARHPSEAATPVAAYEAALAARAAGRADEARRRWSEVRARFPGTEAAQRSTIALARQRALDQGDLEGALSTLRAEAEDHPEAWSELARLREPAVSLSSEGSASGDPKVRLRTRNLDRVELRLHRVDPEAYALAGGEPEGLEGLDVAPITPERVWTVDVPGPTPGLERSFDARVEVPGPGLYAVTAVGGGLEARALVAVSDLEVAVRVVGPDVAVGVFDEGGQPVRGAEVWLVGPDRIEGRTDASGLFVHRGGAEATRVVLARQGRRWALTPAVQAAAAPSAGLLAFTVELDRPAWLPGDQVGARWVARRDGFPVRGTWRVWLELDGRPLDPVEVAADAWGAARVDLDLPGLAPAGSWRLAGIAPGESEARELARLWVAPRDPDAATLEATLDPRGAELLAVGPMGEPLADLPILADGRSVRTDRAGRARVEGPPAHLPWTLEAAVPGDGPRVRASRRPAEELPLRLELVEDLLRPGEPARVEVGGEGPLELALVRRIPAAELPEPPEDPWAPEVDHQLRGFGSLLPTEPEPAELTETVLRRELAGPGPVRIEAEDLPPGRYELRLARLDGRARSAVRELRVDAGALRVLGARDVGLGDPLELRVDGGPALLTIASDRLEWAAVRPAGGSATAIADGSWRGRLALTATGPDGETHAREVLADPDPVVALSVELDGEGARLVAELRDRQGRPVEGSVSFAAWDERLARAAGAPPGLDPRGFRSDGSAGTGAWAGRLSDGAEGTPIDAALLAEDRLRQEREVAANAGALGLLSDNALVRALQEEAPAAALGGLGTSGYGSGGGGYGAGFATGVGGRREGVSTALRPALAGVRERVLWAERRTARGRVEVRLEAPPASYTVRAAAVTEGGVASAEVRADLRDRVWWTAASPGPGAPGDVARPRITVVNGRAEPYQGTLSVGEERLEVRLEPGAVGVVTAAPRPAGPGVVELSLSGSPARGEWSFPLVAGTAREDGALKVVAAGRLGLTAVALRPGSGPESTAAAGRAALAALEQLGPAADPRLGERVREALQLLRWGSSESSVAALFLVEAHRHGGFGVDEGEMEDRLDALRTGGTRSERLWAAVAGAEGGRRAEEDALAGLDGGDLTPQESAWLDRLRGREVASTPTSAPPEPGDPGVADWIREVAPGLQTGAVTVAGRALRPDELAVVEAEAIVTGPALTWRTVGIEPGVRPARLFRVPAGLVGRASRAWAGELSEACEPCVLEVGDGLADPEGDLLPGALPWGGAGVWVATVPGTFTLGGRDRGTGRAHPVRVQVIGPSGNPSPLPAAAALARAGWRREVGALTELPSVVPEALEAELAREVFAQALLRGEDSAIAEAFRALASADPGARLELAEVGRAARALRTTGRPEAAVRAWRAAADASFAAEVSRWMEAEPWVGLLVVLQQTRAAALRLPEGPAEGEALAFLPGRLLEAADQGMPEEARSAGISATDARLTAAAWDRAFLATHPGHPQATGAGLRLARTLLALQAPERAAIWARRVSEAHPGDPLRDALALLEAVALTEGGEPDRAEPLLRALAAPTDPTRGPRPAPEFAEEAWMALGRLEESRGRIEAALEAYRSAGGEDAARAEAVLTDRSLAVPSLVLAGPGEPLELAVEARGVDRVSLRAYRVDLRTLFLRDGGLERAHQVRVDGVSPEWSSSRALGIGPFPETRPIALPLAGEGAWLVQVEAGEARGSAVVVRSALRLAATDLGSVRRLDLRLGGRPAAGAEIRALGGGGVVATVADVRGVAEVTAGAPVLAWVGASVAFTEPEDGAYPAGMGEAPPAPAAGALEALDRALERQGSEASERWRSALDGASETLSLDRL